MTGAVNLKEFVSGFVLEADEHLHSVNRNLVATSEALKQGRPEPRAVRELYRSIHTIKGLASMVGVESVVDIAHEMENILRSADRAGGRLSEKALDLLLKGTRALEERVNAVSKNGVSAAAAASRSLLEALGLAQESENPSEFQTRAELELPEELLKNLGASEREQVVAAVQQGKRAVIIEFEPSAEKAARGLNITAVRERLGAIGQLVKILPRSSGTSATGITFTLILVTASENPALAQAVGNTEESIQEIRLKTAPTETPAAESPGPSDALDWMPSDHSSIRVDIRRLDEALERLADLVVTRSKLDLVESSMNARGVDTRELKLIIAENSRQLKRLREAITEARMVPLAELLQRLPLVVRGLTQDTDKKVNLMIHAGRAEVDKAVADKLFPAVVHLIRNAVDHAIEPAEARKAAGKPEAGNLSVTCDDTSGTSLVLSIQDDGRGIDREAVARKAGRSVAKSDDELLQQIATPGLSTSQEVTHTSGRGMGMEIAKKTIELLGGVLGLRTESGKGTTFSIRVPLSITIVDVLSFVSGDQVYVAPISMIEEILEIDPDRLVKAPTPIQKGPEPRLIQRRGEVIPLLELNSYLRPDAGKSVPRRALVVNPGVGRVAFGVDRMLGQQEVVVRPLDDLLVQRTGMAGATDLGDGRPTLVVDLTALGAAVMQKKELSS